MVLLVDFGVCVAKDGTGAGSATKGQRSEAVLILQLVLEQLHRKIVTENI